MSKDLQKRLTDKCIQIYERKRKTSSVRKFLERLNVDPDLSFQVLDEDFVVESRRCYFPDMTMDSLLEELLLLYRSKKNSHSGVSAVWWRIDNEIPLSFNEYSELTVALTKKINEELNQPSDDDWSNLDNELLK